MLHKKNVILTVETADTPHVKATSFFHFTSHAETGGQVRPAAVAGSSVHLACAQCKRRDRLFPNSDRPCG